MQIRKEIMLFCCLLLLSISLLVASAGDPSVPPAKDSRCDKRVNCCRKPQPVNHESPWNFLSHGLFHLSA
jgi:hypothetical protein